MIWSNYSFAVGLALGGGLVGIIFLAYWIDRRRRAPLDSAIAYVESQDFISNDSRRIAGEAFLAGWELREPGASDIGSRLPLDRRAQRSDTLG